MRRNLTFRVGNVLAVVDIAYEFLCLRTAQVVAQPYNLGTVLERTVYARRRIPFGIGAGRVGLLEVDALVGLLFCIQVVERVPVERIGDLVGLGRPNTEQGLGSADFDRGHVCVAVSTVAVIGGVVDA